MTPQRRKSAEDELMMREFFSEGDLISVSCYGAISHVDQLSRPRFNRHLLTEHFRSRREISNTARLVIFYQTDALLIIHNLPA